MNQRLLPIALALVTLPCALACNDPAPEKTPRKQTLESVTNDIFIPMLAQVQQGAEALDDAARELCEPAPARRTMAELDAARHAWRKACEAWKRTDVMSFGPATMSPYRFASDIDFWPAREEDIEAVLRGQGAASADEDAGAEPPLADAGAEPGALPRTLTATQKGLPAIEYLLFAASDDTLEAFRDGEHSEHRCAYLRRMTEVLVHDSAELARVFEDDFAPDFTLENDPNDRYASVNEAFADLVNNMTYSVESVRGARLARALGLSVGGVPQPELVESRFSDDSIRSAKAVLEGVKMVFFGTRPDDPSALLTHGVNSVLLSRGRDYRTQYRAKHDAAVAALEAIPQPLRTAVIDDPESVEAARAAVSELLMLIQVDLSQALGVTATFGRNDGDGD